MPTLLEKINTLSVAYGGQEPLNIVLKAIGTDIAHEIMKEARPIPPLKKVEKYGKVQLVLDEQDENYLLCLSKYNKRRGVAQRAIQNDITLQDTTFRLLIVNNPVDTNNSEADLKTYLQSTVNESALVTAEEETATIPVDETLD